MADLRDAGQSNGRHDEERQRAKRRMRLSCAMAFPSLTGAAQKSVHNGYIPDSWHVVVYGNRYSALYPYRPLRSKNSMVTGYHS